MYKIIANEKLFNEWQILSLDVNGMKSIVQNDINISQEQFIEWIDRCIWIEKSIKRLREKTFDYITNINKK